MKTFIINFISEMEKRGYTPIVATKEGEMLWNFLDDNLPLFDKPFEEWGVFNVLFRGADYSEYLVTVSNIDPHIADWRKTNEGKDVVRMSIASAAG